MSEQTILDRYAALLKTYALQPDEKHLAAAAELGREMVQADMSLEAISRIYVEALQCLAQERPDMTLSDTLSLVLPFLQQLMTAGDLAHHKRLASFKRMAESLRQSVAEYRAIFETTGTAMLIIEEDTTISLLNTESEKLYGYSREEIEGKRSWTEFVVPDDLERMKEYHRLRRSDPSLAPQNYEFRLIDKHGAVKDILLFIDMIPGTRKSVASLLNVTELKRAEAALKRRATQLAAVAEIGRQIATFLALDTLLDQVVALIREAFDYRYVSLFLVDPSGEELVLRAEAGYEIEPAKAVHLKIGAEGICGWVAAHGEPLLVGDVSQEPRYYTLGTLADTRSELALPVRLKGQIIGVLDVQSAELNAFDEEDIFVLQLLSDQVAVALENTRLFEAEQHRRQEAETLHEAALALTTSLERDEIIERILIQLREVAPYDSASVQLLHGDRLEIIGGHGFPDPEKILGITFDLAEEDVPNVKVMGSRAPLILKDAPASYDRLKQEPHTRHIRSWLGVPLLVGDRAVGMLALDKYEPGFYTEEHAQLALAFAAQAAVAIENAHLYEQAQQEIAERRRAEEEMRISETQKSSLLETIPHAVIGLQEHRIVFANPGVETVFGWRPEELLGKTTRQLYRSQEEYEEIGKHFYPKLEGQPTCREELPCRRKDGRDIVCLVNASRIEDSQQDKKIVVVYEDITERARMEESLREATDTLAAQNTRLAALQRVGQMLNSTLDIDAILEYLVDEALRVTPATHGQVLVVQEESGHFERRSLRGFSPQETELARTVLLPLDKGINGRVYATGQTVRVDDVRDEPDYFPLIPATRAELGVPIVREGKVLGNLDLQSPTVGTFRDVDLEYLLALADQAAIALENARLYAQAQQEIAERRRAEEEMRISETQKSSLLETIPHAVLGLQERRIVFANPGVETVFGWKPEELLGKTTRLLYRSEEGYQEIGEHFYPTLAKQMTYREEFPCRRKDGRDIVCLVNASRIEDSQQDKKIVVVYEDITERARMEESLREATDTLAAQNTRLAALQRVGQMLNSTLDIDAILEYLVDEALRVTPATHGQVLVVQEESGHFERRSLRGFSPQETELARTVLLPLDKGINGRVYATGQTVRVDDVRDEPDYFPLIPATRAELGVPIVREGKVLGNLDLQSPTVSTFHDVDLEYLLALADQAAIAIENARLFQAEQEQRELAEALAEASAAVGSTLDLDEVFARILEQVARVVPGDVFNIILIEEGAARAVRWRGYDRLGIEEQIANFTVPFTSYPNFTRMVESGKTVFVPDTTAAPDWVMEAGQEWRRSYIGTPIQARGVTIGFLNANGTRAGQFNPADAQRLEAFADHAAIAIENARLYQRSQELVARITRLYELSTHINEALSLEETLKMVAWQVIKSTNAHSAVINLLDQEGHLESHLGMESEGEPLENISPPRSNGTTMSIYRTGVPLIASDLEEEDPLLHPSLRNKGIQTFIGLPLKTRKRCTGVLFVRYAESHSFSEEEVQALSLFANQAAVALENARLYRAEQLARERADTLREISRVVGSTLELDETLSLVLRQAKHVLSYNSASILLFANDQPAMAAVIGYEDEEIVKTEVSLHLGDSPILQSMARDRQPILITDVREDERWIWVPGAEDVRAWIGVPLLVHDEMIGVLMLDSTQPGLYTAVDVATAQALAGQVAMAIENARLYTSLDQEKARLELLYCLNHQLSESLDVHDVAQRALDELCTVVGAMRGITLVRELDSERLQLVAVSGYATESLAALGQRIGLGVGNGLIGQVVAQRQPMLVADVLQDEYWVMVPGLDDGVRSALSVPLFSGDKTIGAFSIYSDRENFFNDDHRRLAESIAATVAVAIQNAKLYQTEQRRSAELRALYDTSLRMGTQLETFEELLRFIVEQATTLLGVEAGGFYLYDPLRDELVFSVGAGYFTEFVGNKLKPGEGIAGKVFTSRHSLIIDDYHAWPERAAIYNGQSHFRTILGVPLLGAEGVLGVLDIGNSEQKPTFDEHDLWLAELFAAHASVAIQNARLYKQAQHRLESLSNLNRASQALTSSLEVQEVLEQIVGLAGSVVNSDYTSVALLDEKGHLALEVEDFRGLPSLSRRRRPGGVTHQVLESGQMVIMDEIAADGTIIPPLHHSNGELLQANPDIVAAGIRSAIAVPIQSKGKTLGVLFVHSRTPHAFQGQLTLLSTFANQAAVAFENARLFEAEQQRREEAETLRELSTDIASTLDFDQIVERATHILGRTLGVEHLDFVFPDPDGKHMVPHPSMLGFIPPPEGVLRFPIAHSITGRVYRTGQPALVPDVSQDPEFFRIASSTEVRSELAMPVKVGNEVVAVLNVESNQLHKFTAEDLHFLSAVAAQLAVAIKNARLFQAEREQRELSESLVEAAVAVGSTLELEQVLDRLLEQVERVLPGDACNVMLIEGDVARMARWRGYRRLGSESFASTAVFPLAEAANLQQMMETGKPIMISDTATYPGWVKIPSQAWLRSYLGTPIQVGGVTAGFLSVDGSRPGQFDSADARRLEAFAHHAATAIENAGLYRELRRHAEQLEERVTERTAQLQAQYARLDALLRSVSDGILVTDAQGDLIQTNPVAQRWLTQTLSAGDAERLQTLVRNLARRAQERPKTVLELPGLDLQLNAAPILERETEEVTAVVVAHDVSHIKAMERMKSRFVTNVSHELRTPITTIKLYVALMRQKPKKWEKYLDALTQETEQLARLVEDVLRVSRIDAGRLEIHPQPTSLNVLTELIVSKHQVLARSGKVTLIYQPADPGPLSLADPDQLTQALNNLVRNAIHYTPKKGKVTVSTGTAESRGQLWATMTVADTGMGIPPEELSHIFERFFRGQQPQSLQLSGSGLGLAIVHEIVELHGGRVTVDSQVGVGSTFTIWLPLLRGKA